DVLAAERVREKVTDEVRIGPEGAEVVVVGGLDRGQGQAFGDQGGGHGVSNRAGARWMRVWPAASVTAKVKPGCKVKPPARPCLSSASRATCEPATLAPRRRARRSMTRRQAAAGSSPARMASTTA